ncbi:MAG: 4a-hydroxytetrahydrobiopterin dehydratase [Anaerolineae bacterium]|nr:4a-hydroxytetrahydrobiopterin dehydratase [Anaerolineae bacterium]
MGGLRLEHCVPCSRNTPPMNPDEIDAMLAEVRAWEKVEEDGILRLKKQFTFKNFTQALAFTNKIGALAENEGHHPAILTEWGKVTIYWWTHIIHGLHQNDFIMAAKTDELVDQREE